MKKTALLLTLIIVSFSINAQGIIGKWKTIDDETGKEKSVVEIYQKGDKYFGKVVEILDPAKRKKKCTKCTDSRKDMLIMGMEIIKDLEKDKNAYDDGTILDPKNGKIYDCKMWLKDKNTLNVRGYVLFFYRTQVWHRVI